MEYSLFFLIGGFVLGFAMAWNLGANDVANSMASAVGARAITIKQAMFIAGILTFVGAVFIGGHVTETVRKGIISFDAFSAHPEFIVIGSFSALFAASFWVFVATWAEMPVSSTHSIVGALMGIGITAGGFGTVHWAKVGQIVSSWIISPFFSGILGFIFFIIIRKTILEKDDYVGMTKKVGPFLVAFAVFIIAMSFLLKTPLGKKLALGTWGCFGVATTICVLSGILGKMLISRWIGMIKNDIVEMVFRKLQVFTSCCVALSQGANDVANAVGPVAVIYFVIKTGGVGEKVPVSPMLLAFGGLGIALGIITFGHKVIETVGFKITHLTNTRGFSIDLSAAATILIASKLGLPVSTTHAAVGAVIGIGLAKGFEAVDIKIIFKIILYWLITLPVVALTSILIFKILTAIFV